MRYEKVIWVHMNEYPVLFYYELGDDNFETRKINIYRDGRFDLASIDIKYGTELAYMETPPIEEIMEDKHEKFIAEKITNQEFERKWRCWVDEFNEVKAQAVYAEMGSQSYFEYQQNKIDLKDYGISVGYWYL